MISRYAYFIATCSFFAPSLATGNDFRIVEFGLPFWIADRNQVEWSRVGLNDNPHGVTDRQSLVIGHLGRPLILQVRSSTLAFLQGIEARILLAPHSPFDLNHSVWEMLL